MDESWTEGAGGWPVEVERGVEVDELLCAALTGVDCSGAVDEKDEGEGEEGPNEEEEPGEAPSGEPEGGDAALPGVALGSGEGCRAAGFGAPPCWWGLNEAEADGSGGWAEEGSRARAGMCGCGCGGEDRRGGGSSD